MSFDPNSATEVGFWAGAAIAFGWGLFIGGFAGSFISFLIFKRECWKCGIGL